MNAIILGKAPLPTKMVCDEVWCFCCVQMRLVRKPPKKKKKVVLDFTSTET